MNLTQLNQELETLHRNYISIGARLDYRCLPADERFALVTTALQKKFPTLPENYTVEEYLDMQVMAYRLRLKFLNEEDEMWFKLKWA